MKQSKHQKRGDSFLTNREIAEKRPRSGWPKKTSRGVCVSEKRTKREEEEEENCDRIVAEKIDFMKMA